MSSPDPVAREVVVRGLVQGVLFRDSCRRQALDVGVHGWVRNEYDGSVRAHLEGPRSAVDQVLSWMHDGPRNAVVEDVEVEDVEVEGRSGFSVR